MNFSLQPRPKRVAAAARFADRLFHELAPKVLFFFVALMLIFVLFKLFVAQYSIEFSAFTKAAVAALLLGKIVPLMDWAQLGYRLEGHRRIVVVAGKTVIYAFVVMALGMGERIVEASRQQASLHAGIQFLLANADGHRFVGLVLLVSLVVGIYLALQEIERAMGEGALFRLFFERPSNEATPSPGRTAGEQRPQGVGIE
jgi:hypothetical protein